ncbi:Protein of unknown function, partial [Gryllus bimaculatus]
MKEKKKKKKKKKKKEKKERENKRRKLAPNIGICLPHMPGPSAEGRHIDRWLRSQPRAHWREGERFGTEGQRAKDGRGPGAGAGGGAAAAALPRSAGAPSAKVECEPVKRRPAAWPRSRMKHQPRPAAGPGAGPGGADAREGTSAPAARLRRQNALTCGPDPAATARRGSPAPASKHSHAVNGLSGSPTHVSGSAAAAFFARAAQKLNLSSLPARHKRGSRGAAARRSGWASGGFCEPLHRTPRPGPPALHAPHRACGRSRRGP